MVIRGSALPKKHSWVCSKFSWYKLFRFSGQTVCIGQNFKLNFHPVVLSEVNLRLKMRFKQVHSSFLRNIELDLYHNVKNNPSVETKTLEN